MRQIFRSLMKRKVYTTINILGLGIGLGCAILMATYLIHEFSFDSYHHKSTRIYRVVNGEKCNTFFAMGVAFKQQVPEIEDKFSIYHIDAIQVKQKGTFVSENNLLFAEPSIMKILDIPTIYGSINAQLQDPLSFMISSKMAKKYFFHMNPIGQYMEIVIGSKVYPLKVTGVFMDFPSYSSLRPNFIGNISIAFSFLDALGYTVGIQSGKTVVDYFQEWKSDEFQTFVLLKPLSHKEHVEFACSQICLNHNVDKSQGDIHLQAFGDMYLHSENLKGTDPFIISQSRSMWVFSMIGILILCVATINFILISNAENESVKIEFACRKINGASNNQLVMMIMFKAIIVSFISLVPAVIFLNITLPFFNSHFQMDLEMKIFLNWPYPLVLIVFTLITGICSGLYLGIKTTTVNSLVLLQKGHQKGESHIFKGVLVAVQFAVFILLLCCLFFMKKQFYFSLHKDLGLITNNLIVLDLNAEMARKKLVVLQQQILANHNVVACLPSSFIVPPSDNVLNISYKDLETGRSINLEALVFGPGILELLKIPMKEGVSFNATNSRDRNNIIINEAAAQKFNIKVGEKISWCTVIGITRNFHFHALTQTIAPLFILPQPDNYPTLIVKTNGNNNEVKSFLGQVLSKEIPGYYVEVAMLDDSQTLFYKKEKNQLGMLGFFSFVIFAISVMGLFGYVSLDLSKRTKEIGIRKINGAKNSDLLMMLNLQYLKWVVVAFVVVCPIVWYVMHAWLQNFAYKTALSWWVFVVVGFVALFISVVTVSLQSWRAALRNPVENLRYE